MYCDNNACMCSRYNGERECVYQINTNCSAGQPASRLLETVALLDAWVGHGGACHAKPLECSVNSAVSCISQLGVAVSLHDYTSSDATHVCLSLEHTRKCLVSTLSGCTLEKRRAVMDTFKQVRDSGIV